MKPSSKSLSFLRHVIFDDKCDESVGSDSVVSAMAEKDTYVGIGGMGRSPQLRQAKVTAHRISDLQMIVLAHISVQCNILCTIYIYMVPPPRPTFLLP